MDSGVNRAKKAYLSEKSTISKTTHSDYQLSEAQFEDLLI